MSANPYDTLDKQVSFSIVGILSILALAVFFLETWIIMLVVGALSQYIDFLDPWGFWQTALYLFAFNLFGALFHRAFHRA